MKGVVSFLVDPDTLARVGPQFLSYQKGLGVTHAKAKVTTTLNGTLPTDLYKEVLQSYDIPVLLLMDRGFYPVGGESTNNFPNMSLNTIGDKLLSPYINGWTLRTEGFLNQVVKVYKDTRVICWNEANLSALTPANVNYNNSSGKANSLNPGVAGALFWQSATRWKSIGVKEVYAGALSMLPPSGTDSKNPYLAGYLDVMYTSLEKYHAPGSWPWDGLCVNIEGWWNLLHLQAEVNAIRSVMVKHKDPGIIIAGEWGTTNQDLLNNLALAQPTYDAVQQVFPENYFFQLPGRNPYVGAPANYTDYGLCQWQHEGNFFVLGPDYSWGQTYRSF